jgi:hypothetical protein
MMERVESFADPERELRRYYRTRWQAMLEMLLDWPADHAARWASCEIDTHQRVDFPLAHEHAAYWLLEVLTRDVPAEARQLGKLKDDLTRAIHAAEPLGDDPRAIREWLSAARPEVEAVLRRYGSALPTFDPARDGW